MKKALVLLLGVCFVALLIGSVAARDVAKPGLRPAKSWSENESSEFADPGLRGLYEEAAVDTYCMVWYTFESMNWQGWTKTDETAQRAIYFHVDDFLGLGGGAYGSLAPLEGAQSMWCGARPNLSDPYLCSWIEAPGYGNNWSQILRTDGFAFVGGITLSFKLHYDSEPDYDFTRIEYDAGGDSWQLIDEFDDRGDTTVTYSIALTQARTKLRFHFSADGAWSDQDGLWNTDGGCIIDSITVTDAGTLSEYEDFESAALNATSAGIWIGAPQVPFGSYCGLKTNLSDKDPCGDNLLTQLVYFVGSPNPSSSYPGLYDTPFCMGSLIDPPCQSEIAVSPVIDMTKYSLSCNYNQNGTIPTEDLNALGGAVMNFTVYRDLPLANLVFYQWHVRQIIDGCPQQWMDRNFVYYGPDMDYIYRPEPVSDLLGSNDPVQLGFGCFDACGDWYLVYGNCAAHTPSPWIDNVRLYRYRTSGPQWAYRDLDFFQDNFPEIEYTLESYVRADAANDLNSNEDPIIRPGDSIVVDATSLLGGGIAVDPTYGGPAVYINVRAAYVGPAPIKPNLFGASLAGSTVTGPVAQPRTTYFQYISDDGVWTKIQCLPAEAAGGSVKNRFMVDLNDALFTRGYQIDYYFTANDANGNESALPQYARSVGPYFEFLCLPTKNSTVLFVDDFTGRGSFVGSVENYWQPVFDYVLTDADLPVDRYDVNGPSSGVSNGPGSRAKTLQLTEHYNTIVWDCGDLESVTISDGSVNSDKADDCTMLINWFEQSGHDCGLWVCGDDIAYDLDGLGTVSALTLMGTWCGVDFVATSYFDETGGRTGGGTITPLITGSTDAGIFVHAGVPDKFYAFGGCFIVNQFDVLNKTAMGKVAASYPTKNSVLRYAAIASSRLNPGNFDVRTMWFGFSYQYLRDDVATTPADRFEIAQNVFDWMQNLTNSNVTGNDTPERSTKLAQNFPNPFNPSTKIQFELKDKGFVTLKVYNVAGQLVRTLVSGVRDADSYTITWDGKNDRGGAVASGIYFYKMDTKDFSQTRKMVMLR